MVNLFDIEDKETNKIKVIGEGAYGCVHKPSLKCNKTKEPIKYRNKISKILLKDDAIEEMNEYNIIANIDKNNGFFLGKPTMCSVKQTNENMNAISKCEKGYEFLKKIDNTQLLIMDYGGDNLDTVSQEFSKMKKTKSKGDTTQKRRQSRRREKLNEIAKASGFASWSAYETACLNGMAKPNKA
jgi:hypothetical protein